MECERVFRAVAPTHAARSSSPSSNLKSSLDRYAAAACGSRPSAACDRRGRSRKTKTVQRGLVSVQRRLSQQASSSRSEHARRRTPRRCSSRSPGGDQPSSPWRSEPPGGGVRPPARGSGVERVGGSRGDATARRTGVAVVGGPRCAQTDWSRRRGRDPPLAQYRSRRDLALAETAAGPRRSEARRRA